MKDSFAAHSFRAKTFASGNWQGVGVDVEASPFPLNVYGRNDTALTADGRKDTALTAYGSNEAN